MGSFKVRPHSETIRLERLISASPLRVFEAYLDPKVRELWSAPSETAAVVIEHAEVRTGGSEATRCGAREDMRYRTAVYYHLVEAPHLISFSETVLEGEKVLTAALVTIELRLTEGGVTRVVFTDQVTSFVGPDGVEGHRLGFGSALDNWALHCGPATSTDGPMSPN